MQLALRARGGSVVVAGGDGRDLGWKKEGRGPPAHPAAASLGELAELRIPVISFRQREMSVEMPPALVRPRRFAIRRSGTRPYSNANQATRRRLGRAVTRGDRIWRGVERRGHGREASWSSGRPGWTSRAGKFFAPLVSRCVMEVD